MAGKIVVSMENYYGEELKQRVTIEEMCSTDEEQVNKGFLLSDAILTGFASMAEAGGFKSVLK